MRPVSDYLRNLKKAPRYGLWFGKSALLFRRPARFLSHYLLQTIPGDRMVEMRDGMRIHLSDHPHDVITLFVILVREDYGQIPPGGTVVDIGANLGTFSLYAVRSGARRVFAYEPNSAAYSCLVRNMEDNQLQRVVTTRKLAVSAAAGQTVKFPRSPSAYNRIAAEHEAGEFDSVQTTNLAEILARDATDGIDILKLDCEGAEYDILFTAKPEDLRRVREIRMEYHLGRDAELKAFLLAAGFEITHFRRDSADSGNLWARRRDRNG